MPPNGDTLPTVTTDAATNVRPKSATLNGTLVDDGILGGGCDFALCGFEYGLSTSYGTTTTGQYKITGDTFSQAITGLLPGRTYHFRAIAVNYIGTSYGADRIFKTIAGNPHIDQLIYQHAERMQR